MALLDAWLLSTLRDSDSSSTFRLVRPPALLLGGRGRDLFFLFLLFSLVFSKKDRSLPLIGPASGSLTGYFCFFSATLISLFF